MKGPLNGKIALVTGATRGIGKGIALQLADAGAIVYITGRTMKSSDGSGSLEQTAEEIKQRGGVCIPVKVDHEVDSQIADLFKKIDNEQNGQLDILVNNAYKAVDGIVKNRGLKFWENKPAFDYLIEFWDEVNNVGLRNHYICTVHAARMMVKRNEGLIVFISSLGGLSYATNVPYGVGKCAVDRTAADCGVELRKYNVASISLLVGPVKTEKMNQMMDNLNDEEIVSETAFGHSINGEFIKKTWAIQSESMEFAGKVIVGLAQDRKIMNYSSKIVVAADYAQSHSIRDIDNTIIPSFRQLNTTLKLFLPKSLQCVCNVIPNFVKVPYFILDLINTKFA